MIYVDFCKGENGLWIGCAEYNNGRYFATGRTLDIMIKNIKSGGQKTFKVSASNFILASYQMERGEFEQKHIKYASKQFKSRFWYKNNIEEKQNNIANKHNKKKIVVDGMLYESISNAEVQLGLKPDTIGQALRHGQNMSMGHVIAYANDLPQFKKPEEPKKEKEQKEPIKQNNTKYLYEIKNGVLYVYEKKLIAKYEVENEK